MNARTEHSNSLPSVSLSSFALRNPRRQPVTFVAGEGCTLIDDQGRRYLDLVTGLGVNALGYSHPRITAVIADQASRLVHTCALYGNEYQEPLARELCRLSGMHQALFVNSGTEATEAALKLARHYGTSRSGTSRTRIVAIEGGFHGRTRGGLAVTGQANLREPFEPFGFPVTFVPPNDAAALRAAVGSDVAAVILEPILGEGGVIPLSDAFLQLARDLTLRFDAALVADEIQTGLGRTGKVFAFEWSGIQPDIVTIAKPLAVGLPLGAVLYSAKIADRFPASSHGSTFAGGPLACRVALAFLEEMEALLPGIYTVGEALRLDLSELGPVQGRGLMLGLRLNGPGDPIVDKARDLGLLVNCTHSTVLRFLPSYVLTTSDVSEAARVLNRVLA